MTITTDPELNPPGKGYNHTYEDPRPHHSNIQNPLRNWVKRRTSSCFQTAMRDGDRQARILILGVFCE